MDNNEQSTGRNRPSVRYQFGSVSAAVFENSVQRTDGTTFQVWRTVLQKTYLDESGQFRSSSSLDVNDLPRAILALGKAYEFCLTAKQSGGDPE